MHVVVRGVPVVSCWVSFHIENTSAVQTPDHISVEFELFKPQISDDKFFKGELVLAEVSVTRKKNCLHV